ncbi:HNH endonuclease [Chryseobacterium sp. 6424]|uniref:HNH endonuclease n=1 Tax=Chryseobacterium sp. 6424 TaxID=2039166 RepID=UPI000EFD8306|nr:HNH endonuclease [Chryseobacterium sp. 6424]
MALFFAVVVRKVKAQLGTDYFLWKMYRTMLRQTLHQSILLKVFYVVRNFIKKYFFSEGYDDTLTNGIALCPNLHRASDRGLISISDDYKVIINKNFVEKPSIYNISQFAGNKISLPINSNFHPALDNLYQHRKRFNF